MNPNSLDYGKTKISFPFLKKTTHHTIFLRQLYKLDMVMASPLAKRVPKTYSQVPENSSSKVYQTA